MAVWRPPQDIRVKVIGLSFRGTRLLAAEVEDDGGGIKGYRPLGGSVEFGETRDQALAREFREELRTPIEIRGPWHVFENIFVHQGVQGHEIVFAAEVDLLDRSHYESETIAFNEMDGLPCTARWIDPFAIAGLGRRLYPDGLLDVLRRRLPQG
ncbi:MAG: NUDIX domain-containing protein [Alsobacter sp.]